MNGVAAHGSQERTNLIYDRRVATQQCHELTRFGGLARTGHRALDVATSGGVNVAAKLFANISNTVRVREKTSAELVATTAPALVSGLPLLGYR